MREKCQKLLQRPYFLFEWKDMISTKTRHFDASNSNLPCRSGALFGLRGESRWRAVERPNNLYWALQIMVFPYKHLEIKRRKISGADGRYLLRILGSCTCSISADPSQSGLWIVLYNWLRGNPIPLRPVLAAASKSIFASCPCFGQLLPTTFSRQIKIWSLDIIVTKENEVCQINPLGPYHPIWIPGAFGEGTATSQAHPPSAQGGRFFPPK